MMGALLCGFTSCEEDQEVTEITLEQVESAKTQTATIRGAVAWTSTDDEGTKEYNVPVSNCEITVLYSVNDGDTQIAKVTTDGEGFYSLSIPCFEGDAIRYMLFVNHKTNNYYYQASEDAEKPGKYVSKEVYLQTLTTQFSVTAGVVSNNSLNLKESFFPKDIDYNFPAK